MDKYYRVSRPLDKETEPNEIRLSYNSKISGSIEYGLELLKKPEHEFIFIKALGPNMISKAIFVAEIIKRRIEGVHQITEIGTTGIITEYMPKEEGLDKVELTKQTAFIKITLSTKQLDTKNPGYQPPISNELVKPRKTVSDQGSGSSPTFDTTPGGSDSGMRGRGRGGFRGGRGRGGRGRGGRGGGGRGGSESGMRGRGRGGFRGGRGGFFSNNNNNTDNINTTSAAESTTISNTITPGGESTGEGFRGRGRGGFRGRGRGEFRGRGRGEFRGRGRGEFRGGRGGFRGRDSNNNTANTNNTSTSSPTPQ